MNINTVIYTKSDLLNTQAVASEQHQQNSRIAWVQDHPDDPSKIIAVWDERDGGPGVFQLTILNGEGGLPDNEGWEPVRGILTSTRTPGIGQTESDLYPALAYYRYVGVFVGDSPLATEEPYPYQ